METEFVTVSNKQLHRSRRSRRHRKSVSNEVENAFNVIKDEEQKEIIIEQKQSSPKQTKPIRNKKVWKKSTSQKDIKPMILIQAKQENEQILQKKIHYESTTNRTFLLSLTLSTIKSDPSLIICASYICTICKKLQLFVPSDIIILCHKYYQFRCFAKYIYFTTHSLCTFLKNDYKTFTLKTSESLKNTNHCVATDIHLKYANLINIIDREQKLREWNDLKGIFQVYPDDEYDTINTKIILFDEKGETLCDDGATLHSLIYGNEKKQIDDISSISLLYDIKYGLLLQIGNKNGKNSLYQLIDNEEKEEFIWNELINFDGISSKALMSIFKENLFICSKDMVSSYDLENNSWNQLPSMNNLWSPQLKQLYFDATGQKMFCMGIDQQMNETKYTFDDLQNQWIECNNCISFNYYDVIRNKWYYHPSIFSNYNGSVDSLMWIENNNPNIMYCTVMSWNYNDRYQGDVQYFDNRSSYKHWIHHSQKSSFISNILTPDNYNYFTNCNITNCSIGIVC